MWIMPTNTTQKRFEHTLVTKTDLRHIRALCRRVHNVGAVRAIHVVPYNAKKIVADLSKIYTAGDRDPPRELERLAGIWIRSAPSRSDRVDGHLIREVDLREHLADK